MTSRSCHTGFLHSSLVRNLAASFSIATRAQVASFRQQLQAIISRLNHSPTWVAHAPADDKAICPKRGKGVLATNHLLHVEQMMSDLSEQSSGRGKIWSGKIRPVEILSRWKNTHVLFISVHMFKSYSTSFVSKSFVKIRWRQDTWLQSVFGSPQVTTFPPPRSAQKEPCHSNQRKAWSKSGGVKGILYISILTISWFHWIINWWVSTVSTCLEIPGPGIQQFASATAQKSDNHFVTSFVDPWDKVLSVPGFWSIIMCFLWYRAQSKAIHQATLRWGNASHIFQLLLDSCGIPTCRAGHQKMAPPVSRENQVYSGAPGSIFMPPSGFPKVTTVLFCNTAAKALPVE